MSKAMQHIENDWLAGRVVWSEMSEGEAKAFLKGIIQAHINGELAAKKEAYLQYIRISSVQEISVGDSIFCYQIPFPHHGIVTKSRDGVLTVQLCSGEKSRVQFSPDAVFWDNPNHTQTKDERKELRKKYFEQRFSA